MGRSWQIKRFVTKVINTIVRKTEKQHDSGVSKESLDVSIRDRQQGRGSTGKNQSPCSYVAEIGVSSYMCLCLKEAS